MSGESFMDAARAAAAVASATAQTAAEAAPLPQPEPCRVTPRHLEILRMMAAGETNKGIGAALGLSPKTVEQHRRHIFARLNALNGPHAVAIAMRWGLIT